VPRPGHGWGHGQEEGAGVDHIVEEAVLVEMVEVEESEEEEEEEGRGRAKGKRRRKNKDFECSSTGTKRRRDKVDNSVPLPPVSQALRAWTQHNRHGQSHHLVVLLSGLQGLCAQGYRPHRLGSSRTQVG
jgi:hypothetical protein